MNDGGRKVKLKRCVQCGVARNLIMKATVYYQPGKNSVTTNLVCVTCFLDFLGLNLMAPGRFDYEKAMAADDMLRERTKEPK